MNSDEKWMSLALKEARKALGKTSPNPMVGAVLVRGQKLLAKGYHHRAGLPHAEVEVFQKVSNSKNSTLYVTLEPCCHTDKRTPPCTEAILNSKINKVVVGCLDPNPKVAGKGVRFLKRHGIKVQMGALKEECLELNHAYNHWIQHQTPWVMLKVAASLDGKIALANGKSKWITNEASRQLVHEWRSQMDGVLVGIGTVLKDNPKLNVRLKKKTLLPTRIVLDPNLKIPECAYLVSSAKQQATWIFTDLAKASSAKAKKLEGKGVKIFSAPRKLNGKFQLKKILQQLGKLQITSLLVEGGSHVWSTFLKEKSFQELCYFVAPKILGQSAKSAFTDLELSKIPGASLLKLQNSEKIKGDTLLRFMRSSP